MSQENHDLKPRVVNKDCLNFFCLKKIKYKKKETIRPPKGTNIVSE